MNNELTATIADLFQDRRFPLDHMQFALNIKTEGGAVAGVTAMKDGVNVVEQEIDGATVMKISDDLMARVLNGGADLQSLYLNKRVLIDGNVMDMIRFRDAI